MIFLVEVCAVAKAAGAKLCMIRENFINNTENLVTDGYNMKCLFILHVLSKCIVTQYQANVSFLYIRKVPENQIEMNH